MSFSSLCLLKSLNSIPSNSLFVVCCFLPNVNKRCNFAFCQYYSLFYNPVFLCVFFPVCLLLDFISQLNSSLLSCSCFVVLQGVKNWKVAFGTKTQHNYLAEVSFKVCVWLSGLKTNRLTVESNLKTRKGLWTQFN
jgi:hypothetical protein